MATPTPAGAVLALRSAPLAGCLATLRHAVPVGVFRDSLSTAWMDGEAESTHLKQPSAIHRSPTRTETSEHVWPVVEDG